MRRINLGIGERDHFGDRDRYRMSAVPIGRRMGSRQIGGTIYELPEGQWICPYHFHHGVEEWALVVQGSPTVRTPDGERQLRAGDVVCFPAGPDGAHTARGPGKVLMLSANREPSISVYPDSDKLGTRPTQSLDDGDRLNFRRADAVDYWEGE